MTNELRILGERNVRHVGWLLFGLYIILTGGGRALQFLTGTSSFGQGPPTIEVILIDIAFGAWAFGGALIISRQPSNPIGWIFSTVAMLIALDQFTFGYAYYGTITHPGSLPAARAMTIWWNWSGRNLVLLPISLLFLLFPTGKPLSPRWGKLIWIMTAATLLYILAAAIAPLPVINTTIPFPTDLLRISGGAMAVAAQVTLLSYATMILCSFASIGSLFVRLSRARGVERQQVKWFAFAAVFVIPFGILLILLALSMQFPLAPLIHIQAPLIYSSGGVLIIVVIAGIAVASAIAVLRYRLWDIDIIIRRTLLYSILTAFLVFIYFSSIIVLQRVFALFTGQIQNELVTVVSTLAIAALFVPLRNRIQRAIDKRFYRKKYDAQKVLTKFGETVRDETDLERLTGKLIEVVNETMQPKSVSVWLNKTDDRFPKRKI